MSNLTPTLLLILDGWGLAAAGPGNAPSLAKTPVMDSLFTDYAHSKLAASGHAVGLPDGYIGNSEVGHLTIGAGSVFFQDMTRIDMAIEKDELNKNTVYNHIINKAKAASGRLHLAGLLSDGGVHSHINHLKELTKIAVQSGLQVFIHCFMDGRDTGPHKGIEYINDLENSLTSINAQNPSGKACIATVCGRFYAMDRDTRWDRVKQAWDLLIHGVGQSAHSASVAVEGSYKDNVTDEFIKPTIVNTQGLWQDNDALFLFNFRADRMRELVQALTLQDFNGFERGHMPKFTELASMTAYDASFSLPVAFPKESLSMGLGEVVSTWSCKQLRLAETEKYAHVTYFFNGGREEPFEGEDRILVPSPRDVATYDLAPAMSCHAVTDKCVEALHSKQYTLIVCNLANGDMVGHTGVLDAAIAACEAVDNCVGRMLEAVNATHGRMLIISDHGNCERMLDEQGQPQTAHTTNPVPCILIQDDKCQKLIDGALADVAPTMIALWQKEQPASMQGNNLAEHC